MNQVIAEFLTERMKCATPIDPRNLIVMNGVGPTLTALIMTICDEGDAVLVPSPLYSGFLSDIRLIPHVNIYPVHLSSQCGASGIPWELTTDILEKAICKARQEGAKVRALLLTTPHNPLGSIYTREQLVGFMNFAKMNDLHCIVDEIYLMTVFGEGAEHISSLSIENPPDPERLHILWGFSKDFAMSGFRCGVLVTQNSKILKTMQELLYFFSVSTLTVWTLIKFLSDKEWLNTVYFPTNQARLQESYQMTVGFFDSMKIPYIPTNTGLYVWFNLSQFMGQKTFEAEDKVWKALLNSNVVVNPGAGFLCNEPGWFRIIFANPPAVLEIAFERMRSCCHQLDVSGLDSLVDDSPAIAADFSSATVSVETAREAVDDGETLEDLVLMLRRRIGESDWLEQQTAALSIDKHGPNTL
jgi:aspartate/methionine/tyrosine aminotransferase